MHGAVATYSMQNAMEQAKKGHRAVRTAETFFSLLPIKTPQPPDRLIGTLQRLFVIGLVGIGKSLCRPYTNK